MAGAARGLFFNDTVVAASATVLKRLLDEAGSAGFSGAHLRIENDWTEYGRKVQRCSDNGEA
jgi:hypothetical protein